MTDHAAPAPESPALRQIEEIVPHQILARVADLVGAGARFMTITCLDQDDRFELYYHFDVDGSVLSLHTFVPRAASLPSISGVCFCAFLVENEVKELFGLNITDIAIDYQGHLLLAEGMTPTPMARFPRNGSAESCAGA